MNPFALLFFVFLAIPIVEIYLLIKVGGIIGAPLTIFLVVFTAVLGAWLLRIQGFVTIRRIQQTLSQGGLPAVELMEGALLLIAGALLLTPGFFTDTIGFICLVPAFRHAIVLYAMRHFFSSRSGQAYEFHVDGRDNNVPHNHAPHNHAPHNHRPSHRSRRNQTIEGDYTREDDQ